MQDRTPKGELWKNIMKWSGRYCITYHSRTTLHRWIFIYSDRYNTFYVTENLKIWLISKMPSPDILLKNQLIFIDPALKICALDGKRLLITRVIISLIKNKNKLKINLLEFNVEKRHYRSPGITTCTHLR